MKLVEYLSLMEDYDELVVSDNEFFMRTYFYPDFSEDAKWDCSIRKLAELLDIVAIREDGVVVNLSSLITDKLHAINKAELFDVEVDTKDIMAEIDMILSGGVSENWLERFISCLV